MISESIANASIHAALNPKDLGRKKRTNRSAKLKQCKLDARREQWLSQVKNRGCKDESDGGSVRNGIPVSAVHLDGKNLSPGNLAVRANEIHNYSDSESSPSNSPMSCISLLSSSKSSATNYSGSSSSSSRSSSSSGGSFSGNISDEEGDDDDGCLDDWEAVADALAVDDKQQKPELDNPSEKLPDAPLDPARRFPTRPVSGLDGVKQDHGMAVPGASTGGRAWRPDDASRPPCLPNLSKQHSFPANSDRHYCRGSVQWARSSVVVSDPLSCPICYEDLDTTDSSFHPCLCGFRLCLFCHKRILEEDGRCPGCRKPYQHNLAEGEPCVNRFVRSSSMFSRS